MRAAAAYPGVLAQLAAIGQERPFGTDIEIDEDAHGMVAPEAGQLNCSSPMPQPTRGVAPDPTSVYSVGYDRTRGGL